MKATSVVEAVRVFRSEEAFGKSFMTFPLPTRIGSSDLSHPYGSSSGLKDGPICFQEHIQAMVPSNLYSVDHAIRSPYDLRIDATNMDPNPLYGTSQRECLTWLSMGWCSDDSDADGIACNIRGKSLVLHMITVVQRILSDFHCWTMSTSNKPLLCIIRCRDGTDVLSLL